jgi:hypothetical protein
VNLKKIMAAAAIAAAFPITALGLGAGGVANAAPISPVTSGTPLPQDGHGWGHCDGHGHGGCGGWGGPGWGPGWYGPGLSACISATGPWGYVTGSACI